MGEEVADALVLGRVEARWTHKGIDEIAIPLISGHSASAGVGLVEETLFFECAEFLAHGGR